MLYQWKKIKSRSIAVTQFRMTRFFPKNRKLDLIDAFRKGEEWAFSKLYARYQKPILKYVSQRVKDQEQVQDIVQEIFLKVHRFRDSYQKQYAFSTWLWTIAKNTISDWLRKNQNGEMEFSSGQDGFLVEDEIPSMVPNAETLLLQVSEKKKIERLLGKLTDLQRKVITLRMIHHLSYQEIAKNLGLSISAVKCLVYRSKQALTQASGDVIAFA
jgi:RNA polymerase sigma-70 factor (ECF subfamily)